MKRQSIAYSAFCSARVLLTLLLCAVGCFIVTGTLLAFLRAEAPMDIITVTNTNDSGPGSLRQALADANDGDTIDFAVTGTIGLISGQLMVNKSITISGPGAQNLAVDGNATSRVFYVGPNVTVIASGLSVRNGNADFDFGGGIYNDLSDLTLNDCIIDGNSADFSGGGIYSSGTFGSAIVTVNNTTISGNSAGHIGGASGGGIFNDCANGTATVTINNSTLSGNSASAEGGGVQNFTAGGTGGATLVVSNSTFSGNSSIVAGGGFNNSGTVGTATVILSNSTFSGNLADAAGGSFYNDGGMATVQLANTILNAASGGNIFNNGGTVTSLGYNLSNDDGSGYLNGPGDQTNTDPLLGPLQDNGGPTFTHALLPSSPALDAGDPAFTPPPFYDQRGPGFDRVVNGHVDIGSFEVQAGPTPTPSPTPRPTPTPRSRPTPKARPTSPPHVTPVPPPPSPRPTPAPRP
jgi:hypothetical protein